MHALTNRDTFVISRAREIIKLKYTLQEMVCTKKTLHRMHCAFDAMIFMLNKFD